MKFLAADGLVNLVDPSLASLGTDKIDANSQSNSLSKTSFTKRRTSSVDFVSINWFLSSPAPLNPRI